MEKIKSVYHKLLEKNPNLSLVFDVLFLLSLFCYLVCQMLMTTMLPNAFLMGFGGMTLHFVILATVLRTLTNLDNWKEILMTLPLSVVCVLVSRTNNMFFLMIYAWAMIGTVGISRTKVLKTHVVVCGGVVCLAVFSAFTGAIPNLVYLEEYGLRDSLGLIYPTDAAAYFFYLVLLAWIAWKALPDWLALLLCVPLFVAVNGLMQSDTSAICTIAFACVLVVFILWKRFGEKTGLKRYKKVLDWLLIGCFPLFGILMFVLIFLRAQNTGIGIKLDGWLTGRLYLAWQSMKANGIHALGADVAMRGRGGTTFPVSDYSFIDSSYPLLVIKYGWIFSVLICLVWMRGVWKAIKNEDYRLAFGMALIAFHSLAEHHFIEAYYNILIILPFAASDKKLKMSEDMSSTQMKGNEKKYYLIRWGLRILFFLALLGTSPMWLSVIRTLVGWKAITGAGNGLWVSLISWVIFISIVVFGIKAIYFLWRNGRKALCYFAVFGALIIGGFSVGKIQLNKASLDVKPFIEADKAALETISQEKHGKVYASELPVLYHMNFSWMGYHSFMGEDLARIDRVSVITSRKNEWNIFFQKGFSYIPISNDSAIYSNDGSVITCLEREGYQAYEYYPEKKELSNATRLNLVKGKYFVACTMEIKEDKNETEDNKLADLYVWGDGGRKQIASEVMEWDKSVDEPILQKNFTFYLEDDTPGVVFYVLKKGEIDYEIKDFYVQRVP